MQTFVFCIALKQGQQRGKDEPSLLGLSFGRILVQEILHCSRHPMSKSIRRLRRKEEQRTFNVRLEKGKAFGQCVVIKFNLFEDFRKTFEIQKEYCISMFQLLLIYSTLLLRFNKPWQFGTGKQRHKESL